MKLAKIFFAAAFVVLVIYIATIVVGVNKKLEHDNDRPTSRASYENEDELSQQIYDSLVKQGLDEYAEMFSKSLEDGLSNSSGQ